MAASAGYQLEGGRQLRATLRAAGDDLTGLKDTNQAAASIVADAAKLTAPVVFGSLRDTIRGSGTKTAGIVRAGNNKSKGGVKYAAVRHWGWWKRHIKPNPWVSTAAQATETRWITLYERFLERAVQKIKGQ